MAKDRLKRFKSNSLKFRKTGETKNLKYQIKLLNPLDSVKRTRIHCQWAWETFLLKLKVNRATISENRPGRLVVGGFETCGCRRWVTDVRFCWFSEVALGFWCRAAAVRLSVESGWNSPARLKCQRWSEWMTVWFQTLEWSQHMLGVLSVHAVVWWWFVASCSAAFNGFVPTALPAVC